MADAFTNRYEEFLDGNYDCVVPGSGGKDSFFAAHGIGGGRCTDLKTSSTRNI